MTGSVEPKSADLKSLTDRKNLPEQERALPTRLCTRFLDHGEAAPGYASRRAARTTLGWSLSLWMSAAYLEISVRHVSVDKSDTRKFRNVRSVAQFKLTVLAWEDMSKPLAGE